MRGRKTRKYQVVILTIMILLMILSVVTFLFIDRNIKPTVIAKAESRIQYIATSAMNKAVREIMLNSNVKYTDLVNVLTDNEGKISMIQVNTIRVNTLASETSTKAQELIYQMGNEGFSIPLGSVFNSRILAGQGPPIHIKMEPAAAVSTDFASEFENAGINQTRHKVYLIMKARVRIIIPFGSDYIDITNQVPVAETIIVGDVPNSYVNVDETDKMLNLIPDGD